MKKLFCLLLCIGSLQAQTFNKSKLDSLFNALESHNLAMGSISINHEGQEIYNKSIGFADVQNQIKANELTKYRIGSITKTFTAVVIMQLVEEGKLTLDALLRDYFPKIPNADKITIENLLRHQSGLFNITNEQNFIKWISKPRNREEMVKRIIKNGTVFEPKEKTEYSNTNYILLSYIAEDLDGKDYSVVLEDRIIEPLGLKRTQYGKEIQPEQNEALPYYLENSQWILIEPRSDLSGPRGAGAVVSTPSDLTVFYTALFSGELVSDESLKKMTDISTGMGMGLGGGAFSNKNGFGHDGGIDGFQSFALYMPTENVSIAYCSNAVNLSFYYILKSAVGIYFGEDYDFPEFEPSKPLLSLTSSQLDAYLGTYSSSDFPLKITITKEDNQLFARATGQGAFPVDAVEKDTFKSFKEMINLTFDPEKETLLLDQLGYPNHKLSKE